MKKNTYVYDIYRNGDYSETEPVVSHNKKEANKRAAEWNRVYRSAAKKTGNKNPPE